MSALKWSKEKIIDYVENEGYRFIGIDDSYKTNGLKTRIIIQCKNNHSPYDVYFDDFKRKRRCMKCRNENIAKAKSKWSKEEIIEFVESKGCGFIDFIKYEGVKSEIKLECDIHNEYDVKFRNFQNGSRCTKCANNTKHEYEYIKEYIENEGYKLLSDNYMGTDHELSTLCPKGHEYVTTFHNFKRGRRCGHCYGRYKKDYDDIKNVVESEGYILISDIYENSNATFKLECKNGTIWNVSWSNWSTGSRCPCCSGNFTSIGEYQVESVLSEYSIEFAKQYKTDKCRNVKELPFDFYLSKENTLIEYDGRQHYLYGCFGGDLLDLMNIKYRDNIKTQYCLSNNIKLIRIKYTDFRNIKQILYKELNIK